MKKLTTTLMMAIALGTAAQTASAARDWLDIAKERYLKATQTAATAAQRADTFGAQRAAQQSAFFAGIANSNERVARSAYNSYYRFVNDWISALLDQRSAFGRAYAAAKAYYYAVPAQSRDKYAWLLADMQRWLRDSRTVDGYVTQMRNHKARLPKIYADARRAQQGQ